MSLYRIINIPWLEYICTMEYVLWNIYHIQIPWKECADVHCLFHRDMMKNPTIVIMSWWCNLGNGDMENQPMEYYGMWNQKHRKCYISAWLHLILLTWASRSDKIDKGTNREKWRFFCLGHHELVVLCQLWCASEGPSWTSRVWCSSGWSAFGFVRHVQFSIQLYPCT